MGILDDAIKEHLELKRRHGVPEEEVQRQEEEALGPARRDVAQQPEGSEHAPGEPVADEAGDGQAAATTAVADHEPPAADQETALFDMEEDAAHAEPPPTAPATEEHPVADATPAHEERAIPEETALHEPAEVHEPAEMHEPEMHEPGEMHDPAEAHEPAGAAEATPVEPPPVEPPPIEPLPVEDEATVAEESHLGEAPVGEPGHEPDPDDRLGETQPHGFEAVEDELDDETELVEDSELAEPAEPAEDDGEEDLLTSDPEDDELDVLEDTPDFLQETPEHDRLWFEQKPPRDFDFD